MTEIFESKFHKNYVHGEGEIVEKDTVLPNFEIRGQTLEDALEEYRWYMRDPNAELPIEILEQFIQFGKI